MLYSPGYGDDRALGTGLVSDLASRGYIMVTIDYAYQAAEVLFPGRRVETDRQPDLPRAVKVRIADTGSCSTRSTVNSGIQP